MMQHKGLAEGHWGELSFPQQMANIGSETSRVYKALSSGKEERAERAFARFQELVDLTIKFGRAGEELSMRSAMWEELCRFRELYCGAFLNRDMPELLSLNKYLDRFALIR